MTSFRVSKILVAISSDVYVRNYLKTDALVGLETQFDCHFIADQSLSLTEDLESKPGFRGFYTVSGPTQKRHRRLFNIMMWRHRKKSRTFLYRWLRNAQWHLIDRSHGPFKRGLSTIRWFFSALANPEGLIVPLLGNRIIFPLASRWLQSQIPLSEEFRTLIERENYDAVIIPSAAFDEMSVDLTRVCNHLGITSLCLIDNWDNLSSKTVFWERPSHIGVWGPQATEQATRIHGFSNEQVHEIGTPRFDQYFSTRSKRQTTRSNNFPYILFVGSAMPFDEISALNKIEKVLTDDPTAPADLRIIYRPHPWQQKRRSKSEFRPEQFDRVILDKQMELAHERFPHRLQPVTAFQPDLAYYPQLLGNADCVIGPLTTMLLEAAICLRPVIGLNYYDGVHINTSRRYFSHFDGAEKIPGFTFCNSEKELELHIRNALEMPSISSKESDSVVREFIHISDTPYSERLLQLVNRIIG